MTFSLSILQAAAHPPDCVSRLRYLRDVESRKRGRRKLGLQVARVSLAAVALLGANRVGRSKAIAPVKSVSRPLNVSRVVDAPSVWLVEESASRSLYSNGLVVRREHETSSSPRRYHVYARSTLRRSEEALTAPAGIVFHTTESLILPLEPARAGALLRSREDVLEHARNGRLYNFLIDRFGQVSRIVPEDRTALHAGYSVWASDNLIWLDLNESFLGISFEAESTGPFEPSAAQIHSGRLLTGMLRSRFAIAVENCVTHAQVSVNPDNGLIGYHTDWGSSFPFSDLGLTGGYNLSVASVSVFGFMHDETFLRALNNRLWSGLADADRDIAARASQEGITPRELSARLQQQYATLRRQRHE